MPNKLNPDSVELLRSLHAQCVGARAELEAVLSLPSGYQRDLQDTKPALLRAFERGLGGLDLVPDLLAGLSWNQETMRTAIAPALYATDLANELVGGGKSFREAYRQAAAELDSLNRRAPEDSLKQRISPGACANLLLDTLRSRLSTFLQK